MEQYRPYLQPNCNLTSLAIIMNVPVHHLAFYFREIRKQSFHDYRNEWRVRHAQSLIREGKAHGLTLEAIGQLSGFTTRNTFFVAFKKVEGFAPGTYAARYNHEVHS